MFQLGLSLFATPAGSLLESLTPPTRVLTEANPDFMTKSSQMNEILNLIVFIHVTLDDY